jgi:hypothetical protein
VVEQWFHQEGRLMAKRMLPQFFRFWTCRGTAKFQKAAAETPARLALKKGAKAASCASYFTSTASS